MLQTFKNGQGSIGLRIKLLKASSTTGQGLTGLTSASTGLVIAAIADNEAATVAYTVAGGTIEGITTLGTYAAPTATKCRFKEVDSTNHKGIYELQFADARFAVASAKSLLVSISGATDLVEGDFVVQLQSDDPYVAKPANFQLTSIDANGRLDMSKMTGVGLTGRDIGLSVLLSNGTSTGQLKLAAGYVAMTWADVGAPTTVVGLSGTTIKNTTDIATQTGAIYTRLGVPHNTDLATDIETLRLYDVGFDAILQKLDFTLQDPGGGAWRFTAASMAAAIANLVTNAGLTTALGGLAVPLSAAGTRAAVGLGSANLDTQLGAIATSASNADVRGRRATIRGTVSGTAPSTTQFTPSALAPAGVDAGQFLGRIILFDDDTTTAALRGQGTKITASTAAALPLFTYEALTRAPASGDTFTIV